MSDQTPDAEQPEEDEADRVRPRHQTAAERRSSETVMLDSGNLDDLVAQAKATPPAESSTDAPAAATPPAASSAPPVSEPSEAGEGNSRQMVLIIGVLVIIAIAFVIAYLVYK